MPALPSRVDCASLCAYDGVPNAAFGGVALDRVDGADVREGVLRDDPLNLDE